MLFKNIFLSLRLFWNSIFAGMKYANNIMTTSQEDMDDYSIEINKAQNGGGVFKDILEQRVTKEVEELRYCSYKIARESKKYQYIGNGKAKKKDNNQLSEKHVPVDESDDLPIVLIQDNSLICEDVLTTLKEVNEHNKKSIVGNYTLKIKRDCTPRFLIESYITKIVVKSAEQNYVLDLYCSKYPRQFNTRKDKPFLTELLKIQSGAIRHSDILDFEEISFITNNAWGVDDWFKFSFKDFELFGILEYDGNYVIRLGCQSSVFQENLIDKIYSQSAEEKYSVNAPKENNTIDISVLNQRNIIVPDKSLLDNLENIEFKLDN